MNSKIVIIGGGAAGISALSKLLENGFKNVTLLEAEDRIGGRIHTIPFASNVVDLGAQWCHGEKHNVIYDMVGKYNVLDKTPDEYFEGYYITSEGEVKKKCEKLAELAFHILETCAKEVNNHKSGSFGPVFIKM
jgi:monoamine oxidase